MVSVNKRPQLGFYFPSSPSDALVLTLPAKCSVARDWLACSFCWQLFLLSLVHESLIVLGSSVLASSLQIIDEMGQESWKSWAQDIINSTLHREVFVRWVMCSASYLKSTSVFFSEPSALWCPLRCIKIIAMTNQKSVRKSAWNIETDWYSRELNNLCLIWWLNIQLVTSVYGFISILIHEQAGNRTICFTALTELA